MRALGDRRFAASDDRADANPPGKPGNQGNQGNPRNPRSPGKRLRLAILVSIKSSLPRMILATEPRDNLPSTTCEPAMKPIFGTRIGTLISARPSKTCRKVCKRS